MWCFISTDQYSNGENIKMAFSLAMKEGVAPSRDLQLLLVGAENTGKTCLISSFLGEEFVDGQAATGGVDVDVCKIYCKDWTRISQSEKSNALHHQFINQCRTRFTALKTTQPFRGDKVMALFSQKTNTAVTTAPQNTPLVSANPHTYAWLP